MLTVPLAWLALALAPPSLPHPVTVLLLGAETPEQCARRHLESSLIALRASYDGAPNGDRTQEKVRTVAVRVQPALLVGDDGLAVTSYAGLHRAERITASFSSDTAARTVDVCAADPGLDLAIVRLRLDAPRDASAADASTSAEPAPGTPARGCSLELADPPPIERTWTLLPAFGTKPARVVRTHELGAAVGRAIGGAPLIDDAGRLLGLWRWMAPDAVEAADWIPAKAIDALLAGAATAPALSRQERERRFGSMPARDRVFPVLEFKAAGGSADNARVQARKLLQRIECTGNGCGDQGAPRGKVLKAGMKMEPGPTYVNDDKLLVCKRCEGSGLEGDLDVWRALRDLATTIALQPPSSDVAEALTEGVRSAAAFQPAELLRRVAACPPAELVPLWKAVPGRAVAFSMSPRSWSAKRNVRTDAQDLLLADDRVGEVLLIEPQRKPIADGESILVLGVLAGSLAAPDGAPIAVLERCYVVPIRVP